MLEKVDEGVVLARHLERDALNNVAAIWPNVEIGSVASLFCFSLRFANSFISPADLFFNYPTPMTTGSNQQANPTPREADGEAQFRNEMETAAAEIQVRSERNAPRRNHGKIPACRQLMF